MIHRIPCLYTTICIAGALAHSSRAAQWTVTLLHPAGATASQGRGVSANQQVGYVFMNGAGASALWTGSAESYTTLDPSSADGECDDVANGRQVGYVFFGTGTTGMRASLWNGTRNSRIDLHPGGDGDSRAYGVTTGFQVGYVYQILSSRAAMWSGTSASYRSLHPEFAAHSWAYGVSANQQVGLIRLNNNQNHAALWSGTPSSFVDLHPAGATYSIALDVANNEQVGWIEVGGQRHAGMWRGTAASWIDLNPPGASSSEAHAMAGGFQVGHARLAGAIRACIWAGSATSCTDLSAYLPSGFTSSTAEGIWTDGNAVNIVGSAYRDSTHNYEAVLWTRQPCRVDFDHDGFVTGIDFDLFTYAFEAGDPGADFDADGFITGIDFDLFVYAFEAGC